MTIILVHKAFFKNENKKSLFIVFEKFQSACFYIDALDYETMKLKYPFKLCYNKTKYSFYSLFAAFIVRKNKPYKTEIPFIYAMIMPKFVTLRLEQRI